MDANVLSGNVTILEGRMTTKDDTNVCVISEDLAEKNQLKVGDHLQFHSVKAEEPVQEATIVGIYQVKEQMKPICPVILTFRKRYFHGFTFS